MNALAWIGLAWGSFGAGFVLAREWQRHQLSKAVSWVPPISTQAPTALEVPPAGLPQVRVLPTFAGECGGTCGAAAGFGCSEFCPERYLRG